LPYFLPFLLLHQSFHHARFFRSNVSNIRRC
jgi:hypothetical protein